MAPVPDSGLHCWPGASSTHGPLRIPHLSPFPLPSLAPQVQVVDGRIVINQQSLTVQAQAPEGFTRVVSPCLLCVFAYLFVCMFVCLHVCVCVCVHARARLFVCLFVYV